MSTHHFPAHPEAVQVMLDAPEGTGDGRSEWRWFWITDKLGGETLVFGCFPQGDTYFDVEGYFTEDWWEAARNGLVEDEAPDFPAPDPSDRKVWSSEDGTCWMSRIAPNCVRSHLTQRGALTAYSLNMRPAPWWAS